MRLSNPEVPAVRTGVGQAGKGGLQHALLGLVLLNVGLVGAAVLRYPPLLAQPNSGWYVGKPLVLLGAYAGLVLLCTRRPGPPRQAALYIGTRMGVIAGLLWGVNLTGETFLDLSGAVSLLSTAPFLLGGFLLWGVAGFQTARRTGALAASILGAVWAAMITALLPIAWGFLLGVFALPRLTTLMAQDPDFLRSGWGDAQAFAIANQFDSAFSHLLGALIISSVVGALGAGAGLIRRSR